MPHHCVAFNLVGRAMAVSRRSHRFGSPTVCGRTVRRFDSQKIRLPTPVILRYFAEKSREEWASFRGRICRMVCFGRSIDVVKCMGMEFSMEMRISSGLCLFVNKRYQNHHHFGYIGYVGFPDLHPRLRCWECQPTDVKLLTPKVPYASLFDAHMVMVI